MIWKFWKRKWREVPSPDSCRGRIGEYVGEMSKCWEIATDRRESGHRRDFQIHALRRIAGALLYELDGTGRGIRKIPPRTEKGGAK